MLYAIILIWLLIAYTAAIVARNKNRSGFMWFLVCTVFGPIAILPLLAMKELEKKV